MLIQFANRKSSSLMFFIDVFDVVVAVDVDVVVVDVTVHSSK